MTAITHPPVAAVNAAFEAILDRLDHNRRMADQKDREEQAFWRGQHNSFTKAQLYWLDGVRPCYTGSSYLVSSATRGGAAARWCIGCIGRAVCGSVRVRLRATAGTLR